MNDLNNENNDSNNENDDLNYKNIDLNDNNIDLDSSFELDYRQLVTADDCLNDFDNYFYNLNVNRNEILGYLKQCEEEYNRPVS